MFFSLQKLLDYKGNRYALAKASMIYARKVRYLHKDEYKLAGEKDALVSLKHVLNEDVKFSCDPIHMDDDSNNFISPKDNYQKEEKEEISKDESTMTENSFNSFLRNMAVNNSSSNEESLNLDDNEDKEVEKDKEK